MEAIEEVELREGPLDGGGVAAGGARGVDVLERGAEGAAAEDAAPLRVDGRGCRGDHEDVRPAELLVLLHDFFSMINALAVHVFNPALPVQLCKQDETNE